MMKVLASLLILFVLAPSVYADGAEIDNDLHLDSLTASRVEIFIENNLLNKNLQFNKAIYDRPMENRLYKSSNIAFTDSIRQQLSPVVSFRLDKKRRISDIEISGVPKDMSDKITTLVSRSPKSFWGKCAAGKYSLPLNIELPGHYRFLDSEPLFSETSLPQIKPGDAWSLNDYAYSIIDNLYIRCQHLSLDEDSKFPIHGTTLIRFTITIEGKISNLITEFKLNHPVDTHNFVESNSDQQAGFDRGFFSPKVRWKPAYIDTLASPVDVLIKVDFDNATYCWSCFLK